jgi:hypothetical protein
MSLPRRIVLLLLLAGASTVEAADPRVFCVFDPGGRSGAYFGLMSRYATEASQWGVEVTLKPYTDEETAAKDYEAGICDGVVATGVRLQRFNRFASTIEAIGGLPDYAMMQQMVTTLSTSAGASKKLSQDGNAVVGFIPVGAVYLFVRDRSIDNVAQLAGKRIATLDYDKASVTMVSRVGSIVVPADLGTLGPKFNNGDVDACYVSAPAYKPFELARGLGSKGGILRAPLAQATLQVMVREGKFPAQFVQKSRPALVARFSEALAIAQKAEAEIPAGFWVEIPKATLAEWAALFQSVRLQLRDEASYDGAMLTVMRQLRCARDKTRSECAEKRE